MIMIFTMVSAIQVYIPPRVVGWNWFINREIPLSRSCGVLSLNERICSTYNKMNKLM